MGLARGEKYGDKLTILRTLTTKRDRQRQYHDSIYSAQNQRVTRWKSFSTLITDSHYIHTLRSYNTYVNAVTIVQSASMQIFASSFNAWSQSFCTHMRKLT